MRRRAIRKFGPGLERFEAKQLPSAGGLAALAARQGAAAAHPAVPASPFLISRITNPTPTNAQLNPPFPQVLVQSPQPVPGGMYNILFVSVRNSTSQTFVASDGLTVGVTGGRYAFPILTGSEQWKPGQVFVFYILSKKYYPLNPVTSAGFVFNIEGQAGVAIPGPSGLFQRVRYNPATFPSVLDHIVAFGPGSKGHLLGLPDTAIWEFTAKAGGGTRRVG